MEVKNFFSKKTLTNSPHKLVFINRWGVEQVIERVLCEHKPKNIKHCCNWNKRFYNSPLSAYLSKTIYEFIFPIAKLEPKYQVNSLTH